MKGYIYKFPSFVLGKQYQKNIYNGNYEDIRLQQEVADYKKNKKLYMVSVGLGDSNFKWENWKTSSLESIGSW